MPNWCEGFLKIRGDMQNIKKFLLEGLIAYEWGPHTEFKEVPRADGTEITYEDDEEITIHINRECHITGTRRAFAEMNTVVIFKHEDRKTVVTTNIKQAWNMDAKEFTHISKKYDVDLRLFGYERGGQFARDIIIERGIVKKDLTEKYDDWDWECPNSELGG